MVQIVSVPLRSLIIVALGVLCVVVLADPVAAARGFVSTTLSGAEEVPPVVTDGSGNFEAKINTTKRQICYEIDVNDLSGPPLGYGSGAHIHKAPPGQDGDIVITLKAPSSADGQSSACQKERRGLLEKILANPADYYVNIHTAQHSGGEVRGQLEPGRLLAP